MPPPDPHAPASCDDDSLDYSSKSGCLPPWVRQTPPLPYPPPPSSPSSHGRSTFVTALIIAGAALAFVIICLSILLFVHRRRQERRRREALLEAALAPAAPAAANPDGGGPDFEAEEGGIVHHAWHIRTVGLDEAAIESIALVRYRAGVLGASSDCAVCLGEFGDGELLRLLPKCAHAFHVPCIDTWLRAHVNCPLCRARVLDPAAAPVEQGDPPAGTDADAERAARTTEQQQLDRQASEQQELRVQIDRRDGQSTSPEQPPRRPGPRGRSFRRVASMDSPSPIASHEEVAPGEDEQTGGEKQGIGGAVHCELSSPGCSDRQENHRGMKRSLSVGSRWAIVSRHCRRSSSLLPL